MIAKENTITVVLAAALLVSITGIAGASYTEVSSDPMTQTIPIGGLGTYIISVNTTAIGTHTIGFTTPNSNTIFANLTGNGGDTGALAQSGNYTWNATQVGVYTFTYTVQPQSGATVGEPHSTLVWDGYWYNGELSWLKPGVVVSTTPIPELPSFVLAGIGAIVGLIAIGRRKD